MRNIILLLALLLCNSIIAQEVKIASPDGNYQMQVYERGGKIYYSVDYKNQPIILESSLGISSKQAGKAVEFAAVSENLVVSDWQDGMQIDSIAKKSVDVAWVPPYGERSLYADLYKGYVIDLRKTDNHRKRLQIQVRAYNEGIAFRYHFPGEEYLHITREFTQFAMPEGTRAYFTPRAQALCEVLPLKNWPAESERPLVCLLPSPFGEGSGVRRVRYVLLTETGMFDFARTKFTLDTTKPNTIIGSMYSSVDEAAPYATPWRVIMAAEKPGDLIEHNHLLLNLNPPCEIADPSWIKPGKAMREITLSTEGGKALVDFAVKRNLQYIHFDAGWYGPDKSKESDATTATLDPARNRDNHAFDLQEIIRYAITGKNGIKRLLQILNMDW
jgi:alpha-glucosidase